MHDDVIKAFYEGCTESKELVTGFEYKPSDIAVVFGVYKSKVPMSFPRGEVIAQQRKNNLDVIVLETGYINRGDGKNHHYAAGYNGLNGRADFKNKGMPGDRFKELDVQVKDWRKDGDHILVCGQIPWDASVDHIDINKWLAEAINELSDCGREIVFRPHPLCPIVPILECGYSVDLLADDLKDAWAVVTYNSNTAVEAAIAGIPVFAFDQGSMALSIASKDLKDIDAPKMPDRAQWLHDIAYAQWTPDEMREGLAWRHLF